MKERKTKAKAKAALAGRNTAACSTAPVLLLSLKFKAHLFKKQKQK